MNVTIFTGDQPFLVGFYQTSSIFTCWVAFNYMNTRIVASSFKNSSLGHCFIPNPPSGCRSHRSRTDVSRKSPDTISMGYSTWWKRLSAKQLNFSIQSFSLISIFFEGYDQGVMGGVNASPRYVEAVGIGLPDGTVRDTLHQGGIVSVYYLGCIFGSFGGGWAADRIGRVNGSAPSTLSRPPCLYLSHGVLAQVLTFAKYLHRMHIRLSRRGSPSCHAIQ